MCEGVYDHYIPPPLRSGAIYGLTIEGYGKKIGFVKQS